MSLKYCFQCMRSYYIALSVCLLHYYYYRKTSNISRTLVGNKIVDHSDVVGASPVGAAPTTSSFSSQYLAKYPM